MNNFKHFSLLEKSHSLSTRKILLAILSGVMLTASFPPGKLSFLVWFAFVPLFISIGNESHFQAFKLGLISGIAHYFTLVYWIMIVLGHYGDLNLFYSFGTFVLLSLYLALYPAFFCGLASLIADTRFHILLMPGFWVGLEYIRSKLLTGFPWCLLGYTQYRHLNLIQIADLFGVYGISFFIILINVLIYHLFFKNRHETKISLKFEIFIVALITGGILGYGQYRLFETHSKKQSHQIIKVAAIQGNIDQSIKWDSAYQNRTMEIYQRLTRKIYDFKPDLIVWPETSVPFFFQNNSKFSPEVLSVTKESGAALVFGSPAYRYIGEIKRYYNRAYLITPDNDPPRFYDKVHLVPFGEYVPLKKFLFFINRLVPAAGDFDSGKKIVTLNYRDLRIGVLICFEAIFPEISRAQTKAGADLLVNLTNDAWFGLTNAPYQHLSMAVLRAVENRRPMIRAANTGFSAFVSPEGEIYALSTLFNEEALKASVDISGSHSTFYTRLGDLFALLLLVISIIKIISSCCARRVASTRRPI